MLYRECLFNRPKIYDLVVKRHSSFGKFHGSHIIVHNNKCKQSFIDSDYCEEEKIIVCGALRMDPFIKQIKSINKPSKNNNTNKKSFVLFYFPFNIRDFGLWDIYPVFKNRKKLFRDLHFAILDLAVEHKDIEFVIKPKSKMMTEKSWDFYESILNDYPLDVSEIRNYRIDDKVDAQKIIFESDVVCALQSSTVLESAIANKRIILPLFYDYMKSVNFDEFGWKNDLDLFDVATDKEAFKALVYDAFYTNNFNEHLYNQRINLFKKYFGFYDNNALDRYLNVFNNIIKEK
jgi:hypothetical protein